MHFHLESVMTKLIVYLILLAANLQAADLSDLTWTITDSEVMITDCRTEAIGELNIPLQIEAEQIFFCKSGGSQ